MVRIEAEVGRERGRKGIQRGGRGIALGRRGGIAAVELSGKTIEENIGTGIGIETEIAVETAIATGRSTGTPYFINKIPLLLDELSHPLPPAAHPMRPPVSAHLRLVNLVRSPSSPPFRDSSAMRSMKMQSKEGYLAQACLRRGGRLVRRGMIALTVRRVWVTVMDMVMLRRGRKEE